jgi:hypothetical protein
METFRAYGPGDLVSIDEIADTLYRLSTGDDIEFGERANALRGLNKKEREEIGKSLLSLIKKIDNKKSQNVGAQLEGLSLAKHLLPALLVADAIDGTQSDGNLNERRKSAGMWRDAILRAAREKRWSRLEPMTLAPLPSESEEPGLIDINFVVEWLKEIGHSLHALVLEKTLEETRLRHGVRITAMPLRDPLEAIERAIQCEPEKQTAEIKAKRQDRRVLEIIKEIGYDSGNLPPSRGRAGGAKKIVREAALKDRQLFSDASFTHTWNRLVSAKIIKIG